MAVKRRIVWFSDEDWATLQEVAKDRHATISSVLRDFWTVAATRPTQAMTQAQRDAVLNKVNRGKRP